jgi:alpha-methylacyl-CoA racemase
MACDASSAIFAASTVGSPSRNFSGAINGTTWYPAALKNHLSATSGTVGSTNFNGDIGNTGCFNNWYYGLDHTQPTGDHDLLNVVMHEIAHHLGFVTFVNLSTGARLSDSGACLSGCNDIFMTFLRDDTLSKNWPDMTNTERKNSAINTGKLVWNGAQAQHVKNMLLSNSLQNGYPEIYAPNPLVSGSSVNHWNTTVKYNKIVNGNIPREMMIYDPEIIHDMALTVALMRDIGWAGAWYDYDGDGYGDETDTAPEQFDDTDSDGIGNGYDWDDDGDGVLDTIDVAPLVRPLFFRVTFSLVMGPLHGIRIVEIVGVGPGPYAAMLLADMGAEVIRVERPGGSMFSFSNQQDLLNRNKKCITVNLKTAEGIEVIKKLLLDAHGLIEGNRPGVMEKLGLGPDVCLQIQPRLIYGRMTGWGQDGPLSQKAGHDINYVSLSGALHALGRAGQKATVPLPLIGDFAGGGLFLAFGIACALFEARQSGQGQIIDASILGGVNHLMSTIYAAQQIGFWSDQRGSNLLDGGAHFYEVYRCQDDKELAVGAIEEKFYRQLLKGLGLEHEELPEQMNQDYWPELKEKFQTIFSSKTRDQWLEIFAPLDACVTPVLTSNEARQHPHNVARGNFPEIHQVWQPATAPRFSRSQQNIKEPVPLGTDTDSILRQLGYSKQELQQLREKEAIS